MNLSQVSRITLSPEAVDCIVFWTKDPLNMMDKLEKLEAMGYHYYFQFTLTPYGPDIERNLRKKEDIAQTFRQLSNYLGKDRVLWRYDPIILNHELTLEYHLKKFDTMCAELYGFTKICTISFVDAYHKLNKSVKEHMLREISDEEMHRLASGFSEIGGGYGIEIKACCERLDLSGDGVKPASCIDKEIVESISKRSVPVQRDRNQRPGCGCVKSSDIGVYNTCRNGCIYCYANHSDTSINRNYNMHYPDSDILIGRIDENTKIITSN